MIKEDERNFIAFVLAHGGRIPSDLWGGIKKQEYGYLDKWSRKGWWDYGVSSRSGWLTDEGKVELPKRFSESTQQAGETDDRS